MCVVCIFFSSKYINLNSNIWGHLHIPHHSYFDKFLMQTIIYNYIIFFNFWFNLFFKILSFKLKTLQTGIHASRMTYKFHCYVCEPLCPHCSWRFLVFQATWFEMQNNLLVSKRVPYYQYDYFGLKNQSILYCPWCNLK